MGWFVTGLVALLLAVTTLIIRSLIKAHEPGHRDYTDTKLARRGAMVLAVVLGVLGLTIMFLDSYTIIPARNVGVVNTFGNANRALDNGWHWVAPWSSVEQIDATVKTVTLDADLGQWAQGVCTGVTVRLANQTTACLDITIQWNLDQRANVNELWQRYRGANDDLIGNIQNNVVIRETRRAANLEFADYNPLVALNPDNKATVKTADQLNTETLAKLRTFVDPGISIDTVFISVTHYDAVTQQKLNGYAQALADTQIATQQKLTAEQQRLANEKLASSTATDDPGVLYQNCLNLVFSLAAKGQLQNLPPTFNCGGSSTPVIVGK
jgi:regulator of protease activity HflC (stomatin/prohibitin superfamily)